MSRPPGRTRRNRNDGRLTKASASCPLVGTGGRSFQRCHAPETGAGKPGSKDRTQQWLSALDINLKRGNPCPPRGSWCPDSMENHDE